MRTLTLGLALLLALAVPAAAARSIVDSAGRTVTVPDRIERVFAAGPPASVLVYLARGPDGLETGLAGSINTEIIERVGGIKVAAAGGGRDGLAKVQLEQILAWNSAAIVAWDQTFYGMVATDPGWAGVAAVADG
ncbi:MAG: hypothetical protein WAS21_21450 [Geminicoccaceae bacterium]